MEQQINQPIPKFQKDKLKELLNPEQLKSVLNRWVEALEERQDLEIMVRGQMRKVPFDAFENGRMQLEFEQGNGEYEFELELKWKGKKENH